MERILEIPPIEDVRNLPVWGRTWMYAKIFSLYDAVLELNCEWTESGHHIAHAGIELRTRTGEWWYSLNTGAAISTIAAQGTPRFPEIEVGETLWRPSERSNGIIMLTRPSQLSAVITIVNARERCSAIISTEQRVPWQHSIQLDSSTFQRFLALWGAMKTDWQNIGDPVAQFSWKTLEQALELDRWFFFCSRFV